MTEHQKLIWDGFDDAIAGTITPFGGQETVCYKYSDMVRILVERDHLTVEEAEEYIDFNIVGAWIGEGTPFILFDYEQGDWFDIPC